MLSSSQFRARPVLLLGALLSMLLAGCWAAVSAGAVIPTNKSTALAKVVREDTARRTASSRTYTLADGSHETRLWSSPVNYRDAHGDWQPIDTTLRSDGAGGLRTTAGDNVVHLPRTLSAPVQVDDGAGRSVTFSIDGAADNAIAHAAASTVSYPQVRPGVTATYVALANGLKETLTLDDASADSSYAFTMSHTPGLVPALQNDGSVVFADAKGIDRFRMPAPTVQESGADAPTGAHVAYRLSADHTQLTLKIDRAWLAQANFPVKVDPTVWVDPAKTCILASGSLASTSNCDGTTQQVGFDGTRVRRLAIRFNDLVATNSLPRDALILSANASVIWDSQTATGATPQLDAAPLAKKLDAGATWNTYNGSSSWTTPGGDRASSPIVVPMSATPDFVGKYVGWEVSQLVEQWLRDPSTQNGMLVSTHNESVNNTLTVHGAQMRIHWVPRGGTQRDSSVEQIGVDDRASIGIDRASGAMTYTANDISLPGVAGLDLNISRTYNNADEGQNRWFGVSFFEQIDGAGTRNLTEAGGTGSNARIVYAYGAPYRFDSDPSHDTATTQAYLPAPGLDADLTTDVASGVQTLTFRRTGVKWLYGPDGDGDTPLIQIQDAHGNHIDITYDIGGTNGTQSIDYITDSHGRRIEFTNDANGYLHTITAGTRTWTYNQSTVPGLPGLNRLDSSVDPDGKVTSYAYTGGIMSQITDPRGHTINMASDTSHTVGNVDSQTTSVTRTVDGGANDVAWNFDYTPAAGTGDNCTDSTVIGRTVETDPRGKTTTYCHNAYGQVVQVFDALHRKTSTTYNALANVVDLKNNVGTGNPLHFTYNTAGSPTGGTKPAGETFGVGYCTTTQCATSGDASGGGPLGQYRPRNTTDEQGVQTGYSFNSTGDLLSVRDNNSPTVAQAALTYNPHGTVATSTLGGNTTTYTYNTNDELTTITPPSSSTLIGATQLTYDAVSRVATVTDGNAKTATITRDGEDRVTQVTWTGGKTFVFTYDANGSPTKREEKNSPTGSVVATTNYVYDNLNRRTSETFPGALTNTYGYDKDSNLATFVDPSGTTTYGYDDINRLAALTSPTSSGSNTVTYAYSDSGANSAAPFQQTASFPGGLKQETNRDGSGKIVDQIIRDSSGSALHALNYNYTASASPTSRALLQSVTEQPVNNKTTYAYGATAGTTTPTLDVQRLIGATTKTSGGTGSTVDDWAFSYDASGNRTKTAHPTGTGAPTESYAYNADNELCWAFTGSSSNPCGSVPTGATTYSYDHAGNQTTGGLAYDSLNRLTGLGSSALSYLSPSNDELTGNGSLSYQNSLLGLSRQIPSTGSTTAYSRQPDGTPVAQRVGTTKQYLFTDALGSIIDVANDGANTVGRSYTYDPDGNRATTGSAPATDLGYASGYTLNNTAVHFGARYYDPTTARWSEQDPLDQVTSLQEANRYAYVGGNPINNSDPEGLCYGQPGAASAGSAGSVRCSHGERVYSSARPSTGGLDRTQTKDMYVAVGCGAGTVAGLFPPLALPAAYLAGGCIGYSIQRASGGQP